MNEKVHTLINQQINKEFYSAYLYLNFSNYFEEVGLDGFANWYKIQAQDCLLYTSGEGYYDGDQKETKGIRGSGVLRCLRMLC